MMINVLILCTFLSCCSFVFGLIPWHVPQLTISDSDILHAKTVQEQIQIRMTLGETAFFLKFIQEGTNYFEFGCGGSTLVAASFGPPQLNISSVDSSLEWIDNVKRNKLCSTKLEKNLLHMNLVDIGSIGMWGYPTNKEKIEAWHLYSQSISLTNTKHDRILVDGRFRVACVLYSFLSNPNARVLFHDFFENSHHQSYKVLLQVLDVVNYVDTLVELKIKDNVDRAELLNMYNTYIKITAR